MEYVKLSPLNASNVEKRNTSGLENMLATLLKVWDFVSIIPFFGPITTFVLSLLAISLGYFTSNDAWALGIAIISLIFACVSVLVTCFRMEVPGSEVTAEMVAVILAVGSVYFSWGLGSASTSIARGNDPCALTEQRAEASCREILPSR
ncbi:hypothetical protein [Rhizobium leguminosarum]